MVPTPTRTLLPTRVELPHCSLEPREGLRLTLESTRLGPKLKVPAPASFVETGDSLAPLEPRGEFVFSEAFWT